jgi:hypothetical protein
LDSEGHASFSEVCATGEVHVASLAQCLKGVAEREHHISGFTAPEALRQRVGGWAEGGAEGADQPVAGPQLEFRAEALIGRCEAAGGQNVDIYPLGAPPGGWSARPVHSATGDGITEDYASARDFHKTGAPAAHGLLDRRGGSGGNNAGA